MEVQTADRFLMMETVERAAARNWRLPVWVLSIALILVIHVLGRVGAFCAPYHADSYAYSTFAYRMAQGQVLYRDLLIDKPPGQLWLTTPVYWIGPPARWPLIPQESVALLLGYWAFFGLCRQLYSAGIALVLTILGALAINTFLVTDYTIEGFNLAESYMIMPMSLALLYYHRGWASASARQLVLAGACLGITLCLKQTVLPLSGAIALHLLLFDGFAQRRWRMLLVKAGYLAAGGTLVLAAAAIPLIWQGTLVAAFDSMTVRAVRLLQENTAWPAQWRDVLPMWVPLSWGVLGLAGWSTARWRQRSPEGVAGLPTVDWVTLLVTWFVLECLMLVYLPRRGFHYYAISCLPVILLAGVFWAVLRLELSQAERSVRRSALAGTVIWSLVCLWPTLDVFVPLTIARWRAYDPAFDQAGFAKFMRVDDIGTRIEFPPENVQGQ